MNVWITSWLDMNRLLISWPTFICVIFPVPPWHWHGDTHTYAQRIGRKWAHTQSAWTKFFLIFIKIREQGSTINTTCLITAKPVWPHTSKTSKNAVNSISVKSSRPEDCGWYVITSSFIKSTWNCNEQRERVKNEMKNMLLCLEFNKTMSSVYVHFSAYPFH